MKQWVTYLVVVICKCLPIIVTDHLPLVIEMVVLHIESLQSWLFINSTKALIPGDLWSFICIEVHPDKVQFINVNMNMKQIVGRFVERGEFLILGRF